MVCILGLKPHKLGQHSDIPATANAETSESNSTPEIMQQLKGQNHQWEVLGEAPPPYTGPSSSTAIPTPAPTPAPVIVQARVAGYAPPPEMTTVTFLPGELSLPTEDYSKAPIPPSPIPLPPQEPRKDVSTAGIVAYMLLADLPWAVFAFTWIWTFWWFSMAMFLIPLLGIPFFIGFAHTFRALAIAELRLFDALFRTKTHNAPRVGVPKNDGTWWAWYSAVWREPLTMQAVGWSFVKLLFSPFTFIASWIIFICAPIFVFACIGPKRSFKPIVKMAKAHHDLIRRILKLPLH